MSQNAFTDGLGYEGKVTLTLKSNNRVLSSKTYKNSGTAQLFKFLGYCLIDSYEEAKKLLPSKILLLYNSTSPYPENARNVDARTTWQGLAQTPTIISDSGSSQVKVIYSFEISKAAIAGPFNQVALYGAGATDDEVSNFSAYYYLVDDDNNFDLQDVTNWSATTILLIEWELTISNKNIETVSS